MAGTRGRGRDADKPRRRIWVQHVAVDADEVEMRVDAAVARGDLTASQEVITEGVRSLLRRARAAAMRDDPVPRRWTNWLRGTLVEAAYRNLHAARAQAIDLYDDDELRAEIPLVVTRTNATLPAGDPRRITVGELTAEPMDALRARLRRLVDDAYERLDLEHAQLRSFRNIVLLAAFFIVVIVGATLAFVSNSPDVLPLCFPREVLDDAGATISQGMNCPTTSGPTARPSGGDILIVALLGALGGALSATVAIRNLKGTSTPYDVPVALAFLKVPLGALTAILVLVAIPGDFVPGLSVLDSQNQILAYALIFGVAQQVFSRLLDRRAQDILEGLPGGTASEPAPKGTASLGRATFTEMAGERRPSEPGPRDDETGPGASVSRPVGEPEDASQEDQYALLRDTGNERHDMSEDEEARLLEEEFGPPDADGVYGAPAEMTDEQGGQPGDQAREQAGGPGEPGTASSEDRPRPVDEPGDASQEDQYALLRDTGNERHDMSEDEEARLLEEEFGPPDADGVYGAPEDDSGEGRP